MIPTSAPTVAVSIGSCSNFGVQAGSAILFSLALTVVRHGSVGNSPGTDISGNYELNNGTVQRATPLAIQCAADIVTAFSSATSSPCMYKLPSAALSGTLTSGVYCSSPGTFSISPWTNVYLDARNNSNAQWIFQADSTVITGFHSAVILRNGAQSSNVYWAVGSSATLGYSSTFIGQILAKASITVNPSVMLGGRALAKAAVTFQSGALVDYSHTSKPTNVSIGTCGSFSVLAGTTLSFGTGGSVISSGSIGTYPSQAAIGGNYSLHSGSVLTGGTVAGACAKDFADAYNAASTISPSQSSLVSYS
jgi:Ice-binding-like